MNTNKFDFSNFDNIVEKIEKTKKTNKATIILSQLHESLKEMLLTKDKGGRDFTFSQVSAVILELTGEKIGNQAISKYAKEVLGIERVSPIKVKMKEKENKMEENLNQNSDIEKIDMFLETINVDEDNNDDNSEELNLEEFMMLLNEKKQINIYIQKLKKDRKNNIDNFFKIILKEINYFYDAADYTEQINNLCNICVCIFSILEKYEEPKEFYQDDDINKIFEIIQYNRLVEKNNFRANLKDYEIYGKNQSLCKIILICKNYIESIGFNFDICLEEKLKEIDNNTNINMMNKKEAINFINNSKGVDEYIVNIEEKHNCFVFTLKDYYVNNFERNIEIPKLYEADYIKALK